MNVFEIIEQIGSFITLPDIIICLGGLTLFCGWLVKTFLGRNALIDSMPRRNNMPVYMPFIPLFIWFGIVAGAISITRELTLELPDWKDALLDNIILCIGGLTTTGVIVFLARVSFARRLKGFGLNPKTIGKDFFFSVVNLLSVWPFVTLAVMLTIFFGQLIWGQDFQLNQHEELELITAHSQLSLRILIVLVAVIIAPVLEEMLFRGLFQTMMRSYLAELRFSKRPQNAALIPWLSVLISSGLFATIHANTGHWPALFVLAICMGYSYEKSGSLFRPIFIHAFFNAASIIAVLNQ